MNCWFSIVIFVAQIACVHRADAQSVNTTRPSNRPATTAEAAQVIDLRSFPLVPGGTPRRTPVLASVSYEAPGSVTDAFEFIRKTLHAQKWTALPDGYESDRSSSGTFARDGYKLSVSVSEARGTDSDTKVDVQIINHGNVDTSKLPTPKGAQPFYSIPTVTSYLTSAPATETAAAVRELLSADGWEPYGVAGDSQFFKQNAVQLTATVATAPAQQGKTMISYSMSLLSLEIPLPPGADRAQYTDSPPQLSFDVKQSMEDVTGFYRQSLRNHGWKATTDELIKIGFRYFVIFRNAQKDLLELRLSTFEDKTRGLVQFSTAAEVAVREKKAEAELERKNAEANKPKPKLSVRLPLTAMHVQAEPNEIEFTVRAGIAKATAEDLQKQLHTAGWKTEDAMLEGMFGTVSLKNGRQSVSLTYVDSGVLPAEVTISSIDVALEVAKE